VRPGPGRPRRFCRASCRQADYVARQRRHEAGLSEAELIVARAELEELRDRIYMLEAAVEDVERDRLEAASPQELAEALQWLLEAARPVVDHAAHLTP
jgi:Lon protease-like protein